MHRRTAIAAMILLSSGGAMAATDFDSLDSDKSGALSPEEASQMPGLMDRWRELDVNDDGRLDMVEFAVIEPGAAHPEAGTAKAIIVPVN